MSKPATVALGFAAVLALTSAASAAELFKATLAGDQEVPAVATPAQGKAHLRLDDAELGIRFTLRVHDGVGITQAHIHCAPAGENGPIVVFLAGLHAAGLDVDGKWVSNATVTDGAIVNTACGATVAELAEAMRAGDTYVNVHSLDFPAGEIRGQIAPAE